MKNKTALIFGILIVGVVGLLFWARALGGPKEHVRYTWPGTDVSCLVFGHQNLSQHIHPILKITVDGATEPIPANIGISSSCMAEVHTHDGTGQIHVESVAPDRTFTILDFLAVRGASIDREGYTHTFYVNGELTDPAAYTLKDLDQMELRYTTEGKEEIESTPLHSDVNFNLSI